MKRTNRTASFVLTVALTAAAAAQQGMGQMMKGGMMNMAAPHDTMSMRTGQGMMQGGRMSEMGENRMHGSMMAGMSRSDLSDVLHGFGCPDCFLEYSDALGLTKEQIQKLESLRFDCQKAAIRKRADEEVLQLEIKQMLGGDPVDWKSAQAKVSEFCKLNESMLSAQLECLRSAEGVLMPAQLGKFKTMNPTGMRHRMMGGMMMGTSTKQQ